MKLFVGLWKQQLLTVGIVIPQMAQNVEEGLICQKPDDLHLQNELK